MKKQTKVLVTAAILTLGASFSAMAAQRGTWDKSDSEWKCYDKDNNMYKEEWCLDNGVELWLNEDGVLGSSQWVEGENDNLYYAQSDGSKAKSVWKYIFGMDDEEAEEESWFYFDAKGKMLKDTSKKIGDYTYYFDKDGKMLTGWIEEVKEGTTVKTYAAADQYTDATNAIYCNEDGSRASMIWLNCFPFDTDKDIDDLYESEDEVDYYITAAGKPQTGINKDINGLTYFFGTNGRMLNGWVGTDDGQEFVELEAADVKKSVDGMETVYYAVEKGYARKNRWEKLEAPNSDDSYWYYFDKNGKVYVPEVSAASDINEVVTFVNGDYDISETFIATTANATAKRINGVKYLFNAKGEMLTGFVRDNDGMKYYGTADQGIMQTGSLMVEDADGYAFEFFFAPKTIAADGYVKGVAVTGNANGYLYNNGQLMKAVEEDAHQVYEVIVNGQFVQFVVNDQGKIQHKKGKKYNMVDGSVKTFIFEEQNTGVLEDCIKK